MQVRRSTAVPRAAQVVVALVLLVLAGCSDGGGGGATAADRDERPTTTPPPPPLTYVAVGASETAGTGADDPATQAWPRVLADRLGEGGREVRFTSLGIGGATVPRALAEEVPRAEQLRPGLVTVWLNVNDLLNLVPPDRFEQQLGDVVARLRATGATVLVANTPAVDRLPVYTDCLTGGARCPVPAALRSLVPPPARLNAVVDGYNAATARVAERTGARVVDLHAASLRSRAAGVEASLVAADGFHPSTAGHAAVAAEFLAAARAAGV